jgi:serine protease AprX
MIDISRTPLAAPRCITLAVAVGFVFLSVSAEAGARRPRLSRDLADRVAARTSDSARVIVTGTAADVQLLAARYGARVTKSVRGGAVLEVTGGQLVALSEDPDVDHLSGDVPVQRMMAVTTEATGATQVWGTLSGRLGFTGRGIGVAVIDSGVSPHAALRGRIVASVNFRGRPGAGGDRFGHGTHVAGIIAGSNEGGYAGIAPEAHIVSLRVLGTDGAGDTSDVINAIDWAIAHKAEYQLRVINLSLGHPVFESYRDDPLCRAVERAVDAGLVVVAAAGNLGKTDDGRPVVGGVISPANTPAALTVGALNTLGTPQRSDDVMATYSSRGPTRFDGVLKPELVAPGNKIVAPAAAGSYLAETYPAQLVSDGYIQLSGTSMASAVVAGAVALLLQANPSLSPADTKLALQLTSSRVAGAGLIEAGAGSLNVAAAVALGRGRGITLVESHIAGEVVECGGVAFGPIPSTQFVARFRSTIVLWASEALWGSGLVWGNHVHADILVWGNSLVWGNGLVWGNSLVWGNEIITADILVWGNSVQADGLVWGNILVWGNNLVHSDILVWGNATEIGD